MKPAVYGIIGAVVAVILLALIAWLYMAGVEKDERITQLNTDLETLRADSQKQIDGLNQTLDNLRAENIQILGSVEGVKAELQEAKVEVRKAREREKRLKGEKERFQALVKKFAEEKNAAVEERLTLEQKLRGMLERQDIMISSLSGKLKVEMASQILFESGSATLKEDGKKVLEQLALAIKDENQDLVVQGHTDNIPTRGSVRFPTNWELSASRAISAVRYLEEVCEVPGESLSAAGYGDTRPVADNDTKEGRARNRRIEITLAPVFTPESEEKKSE